MAGPYYVDPAGSNTSPYDTWAKAATSIQTVADIAEAGEIVYCRGTETIVAQVDFDTKSGSNAAGWIRFIGCNAAGNVDGTRFIIDANNANIDGIVGTVNMVWMQNIEVKRTGTEDCFRRASNCNGWVFINCCANNCAYGWSWLGAKVFWYRCLAYACTWGWYDTDSYNIHLFCCARDNTIGFTFGYNHIHCLVFDNASDQIQSVQYGFIYGSVIEGGADDGIVIGGHTSTYLFNITIGCRITNHDTVGKI